MSRLPGPEQLESLRTQHELQAAGILDLYTLLTSPLPVSPYTTTPCYEWNEWVRTTTPSMIFSDSLDEDLSVSTLGMVPLSRTYAKINMDTQRLYGLPLASVISHEYRHINEPEPGLSLPDQEAKTYYLNGDRGFQ